MSSGVRGPKPELYALVGLKIGQRQNQTGLCIATAEGREEAPHFTVRFDSLRTFPRASRTRRSRSVRPMSLLE